MNQRDIAYVGLATETNVAVLGPLAYYQNVARLSFFYSCQLKGCSCEPDELVSPSYSRGSFTSYCDRLHDRSVTSHAL